MLLEQTAGLYARAWLFVRKAGWGWVGRRHPLLEFVLLRVFPRRRRLDADPNPPRQNPGGSGQQDPSS